MAPKSKKRLSKVENKLLELENLQLHDVICPICQSILIQPVTLPCYHGFCLNCFNGSIENNALCCPLCRLRIGSWLRTSTKQRSVVNNRLWNHIQTKFSHEVDARSNGEDITLPEETHQPRLSAPGEIRSEYEAELKRLRNERLLLEQKQIEETELLVKKLQEEEEEAHRKYLEALKKDEMIALEMQKESLKRAAAPPNTSRKNIPKPRLKDTKIDSYLSKHKVPAAKNPSTEVIDGPKAKAPVIRQVNGASSPEMVPSYRLIKSIIEKKNKLIPGLWNKENGDKLKEKKEDSESKEDKSVEAEDKVILTKNGVPSLLVSLPLPYSGILQQKVNLSENRKETGSVDSMREELCFFKPILVSRSASTNKELPLRVPGIRATPTSTSPCYEPPPSRTQYIDSLCHLRNLSLAKNLPSAFVIALNVLKVKQDKPVNCDTMARSKVKKISSSSPSAAPSTVVKREQNRSKHVMQAGSSIRLKNTKTNLKRTRSMGSITKNETTPTKAKIKRKAVSDRKPYLRSDSKKSAKKEESPYAVSTSNNKINLAVKNLSSPLKNCEVKHILHEQLRIEKIIEQEKSDFEFARQLEAELNVPRTRRAAIKRQVTLGHSHGLRPAKKLKV